MTTTRQFDPRQPAPALVPGQCGRLQRKANDPDRGNNNHASIPPIVHGVFRSPGQPLDPLTRAFMEPRFGHDFSRVRVHTGTEAVAATQAVNARAFAIGNELVFADGRYAPATEAGKQLLAHELAHVIQQQIGRGGNDRAAEDEADAAAGAIRHGRTAKFFGPSGGALQRQSNKPAAEEDAERDKIVTVSKRTGDLKYRAWELVWRMLTRYFPEYSPNISAVGYDEKEPGVRVQIRQEDVNGKRIQTAIVTVGQTFVENTSDENLRARIKEIGQSLSGLQAIPDSQAGAGTNAVWKLIHEKFPKKGRRISGSSYDANLPGLRTEFDSGEVQAGQTKVSWAGPMLYHGKAFLALPDAEKEAKLKEVFKQVDTWSVANGRLASADLDDDEITLRIRGLSTAKLTALRDKVTDPQVKAYVANLVTTSTPLKQGLQKQSDGTARVTAGNITVIVEPDTTGVAGLTGGDTAFQPSHFTMPQPTLDAHGIVTGLTPPQPLVITIHTRYGAGVDPGSDSGYGRGTSAADKAVEGKSLRVHEGSHGEEYLALILRANADHPYPSFTGAIGDTRQVFQEKVNAFTQANNAFFRAVNAGTRRATRNVDCVGVTIDQFHHTQPAVLCR